MRQLLQDSSGSSSLIAAFAVAIVGIVCALIILGRRLGSLQSRWRALLEGARGETLEKLLYEHLRARLELQERVEALESRVKDAEGRLDTAKRHLGLVRYDAFPDVGGSQSFALAFYDDHGDGCIVTSLVGRNDCRVYCKPLSAGRSERTLSQEESRAIGEAKNSGPRSIVSP